MVWFRSSEDLQLSCFQVISSNDINTHVRANTH